MTIRFGSTCSGIEAASMAWPFWEAAWFSEIDPFPCALLAQRYPSVPNYGDMTTLADRILAGEIEAPDVLCGGTPCQAFSVAGNRKSLDDNRGALSLSFCEIADAIDSIRSARGDRPAVIIWENVPGVLNTKDNAFGCLLGRLAGEASALLPPGRRWSDAGVVYGPKRTIAWRVLDAQHFELAQRRKRVFIIGSAGDFNPIEVLFEFGGARRDSAPSREEKKKSSSTPKSSIGVVGHRMVAFGEYVADETASTIKQRDYKDATDLVCADVAPTVTHGPPFSRTGNQRVELDAIVAYGFPGNWIGRSPDNGGNATEPMVDLSPCITAMDVPGIAVKYLVRRLTPTECETLQGFPKGYTNIHWKNKPYSPDSWRYKAIGNSWAVPVVRWIGERIDESLKGEKK